MKKCVILIIASILVFSCKKDKFPSTPTIITGKVVDQNNIPIEGYEFQFGGTDKTGFINGNSTFDLYNSTNEQGVYLFSIIVPSSTDLVEFQPIGKKMDNELSNTLFSDIYLVKDGKNMDSGAAGPINYGTTNTFNYQVIIRKPDSK